MSPAGSSTMLYHICLKQLLVMYEPDVQSDSKHLRVVSQHVTVLGGVSPCKIRHLLTVMASLSVRICSLAQRDCAECCWCAAGVMCHKTPDFS